SRMEGPSHDKCGVVEGTYRAPAFVAVPPPAAVVAPARRDELVVVEVLNDGDPRPVCDHDRGSGELRVELVGMDNLRPKVANQTTRRPCRGRIPERAASNIDLRASAEPLAR